MTTRERTLAELARDGVENNLGRKRECLNLESKKSRGDSVQSGHDFPADVGQGGMYRIRRPDGPRIVSAPAGTPKNSGGIAVRLSNNDREAKLEEGRRRVDIPNMRFTLPGLKSR